MAARLHELQHAISVCDAQVQSAEHSLAGRRQQLQEHSLAAEEAHMAAVAKSEKHFAEEFEADRALTEVFTRRAHDSCIQALLRQQDAVLEPQFYAHREQLLERASNTLESVMAAQAAQQRAELQSLAAEEEASFEKRVKRAGACTLSCYCMSSVCVSLSLFLSLFLSLPR